MLKNNEKPSEYWKHTKTYMEQGKITIASLNNEEISNYVLS